MSFVESVQIVQEGIGINLSLTTLGRVAASECQAHGATYGAPV